MMHTLFHHWWLPLLIFVAVIGGIYAYEMWGPRSANAAVELPVGRMLAIVFSCLSNCVNSLSSSEATVVSGRRYHGCSLRSSRSIFPLATKKRPISGAL